MTTHYRHISFSCVSCALGTEVNGVDLVTVINNADAVAEFR